MLEIVYSQIVTWAMRALFIVGIYLFFRHRNRSEISKGVDEVGLGRRIAPIHASMKQHVTKTAERPLMTISESASPETCEWREASPARPQFISRDSLLATLANCECVVPRGLQLFSNNPQFAFPEDHVAHKNPRKDQIDEEKTNLQSLVQFRLFKTSEVSGHDWGKWNEEARKILKAARSLGLLDIVEEVRDALLMAGVLPDVETYAILVELSVAASDVEAATGYIDEMIRSGYVVESTLLRSVERMADYCPPKKGFNKNAPVFIPRQ
jgi:hypothetical protein